MNKHQWKQIWQDVHACVLCNATYSDKTADEVCPKMAAMNDKRDEVIDRDKEMMLFGDIQKIIGADKPYEGVHLARYVESREAELRRQIADELIQSVIVIRDAMTLSGTPIFEAGHTVACTKIIDELIKLRGNK